MCALVLLQQGGASEHLVADGTPQGGLEVFGVAFLDMLPVVLQRGKTKAALLTVVWL